MCKCQQSAFAETATYREDNFASKPFLPISRLTGTSPQFGSMMRNVQYGTPSPYNVVRPYSRFASNSIPLSWVNQ